MSPLPFPHAQQLCRVLDTVTSHLPIVLPGQPCLPLDDSFALAAFLATNLISEELDPSLSLGTFSHTPSGNVSSQINRPGSVSVAIQCAERRWAICERIRT